MTIPDDMPSLRCLACVVWPLIGLAAAMVVSTFLLLSSKDAAFPNGWSLWQNIGFVATGLILIGLFLCPGLYWASRWARRRKLV